MTKLSIVTATYNRINTLRICLESVKKQIYQNFEHIIIDNNSTDGTAELIEEYKQSVSYSVKYVREQDTGIYNALNKGIKNSSGEWIHFLHSDDYYLDEKIIQKVFSKTYPDDTMLLAADVLYGKNSQEYEYRKAQLDPQTNKANYCHTGLFINKKFFEQYGLYEEKYKIISDIIHEYRFYPKVKNILLGFPIIFMADTGTSSKYSYKEQYERMLEAIFYSDRSVRDKIKSVLSFLKHLFVYLLKNRKF